MVDFWAIVRMLQQTVGQPLHTDAEWEAALRAAQEEGAAGRGRRTSQPHAGGADRRYIRVHGPALDVATDNVEGRTNERSVMNAFLRDASSGAPTYLCWQSDAPVGKTALLADYLQRHPPADVDVLSFFVSSVHGTDTQAAFSKEIAEQMGEFLGEKPDGAPVGPRKWRRLFADAAKKSKGNGRRLVLVVDGLDDDVAWSGLASEGGSPACGAQRRNVGQSGNPEAESGNKARSRQKPVRGSIAALLPSPPHSGMRVIVSLRSSVRFPDDVPNGHPLRQAEHLRTLLRVPGVPPLRQPLPDTGALGESVAELLAVSGGGLRIADLAELTGLSEDRLNRVAQGPAGRAIVLDDPVSVTYALAEPQPAGAVRKSLDKAAVERHTRELLAWSQRWHAAGWPAATPPYPLAYQLRLLTDGPERAAYVLDVRRLRRLTSTSGATVAVAQLDAFEEEIGDGARGLATLVSLCAVRALLREDLREVPDGAPALLVRLGYVERARGLARSAPTPSARAVHLADVAVEMAYAARADLDSVVREAVEWLARSRVGVDGRSPVSADPDVYTRLLGAIRTLVTLERPDAARPLLRAVVHDRAAGTEALVAAAGLLNTVHDVDVVALLYDRAEDLTAGGMRDRTAAVDLWGALARAVPSLGLRAGDHIEAICADLDPSDGLEAVSVRAAGASALHRLPGSPRHHKATKLMQTAAAGLNGAIQVSSGFDAPSACHRIPPGRELATALTRLAHAVKDTKAKEGDLDEIKRLLNSASEQLRSERLRGDILVDSMLERALWVVEAAVENKATADSDARAKADGKRKEKRRTLEQQNIHNKARAEAWSRAKAENPNLPKTSLSQRTRTKPEQPGSEDVRSEVRRPSTSRNRSAHRASAGMRSPDDASPQDESHFRVLLEADHQLGSGNLPRSQELLETALRRSPRPWTSQHPDHPPVPDGWTTGLCQALGIVGTFSDAEGLAAALPDPRTRARHLAALSLGCSLGDHGDAAVRYAREAASLVSGRTEPGLANAVAQALGHAGDGPAACAMATGGATQRRQALTAVAAGLVSHDPEAAARVVEPLVERLALRIERGSPLRLLPQLASLLVAFPNGREPDQRLRDALHQAVPRVADTPMPWHAPSMTVLVLLQRFGCLPKEDSGTVAVLTDRWQQSLRPTHDAGGEVALLAAMEGDVAAAWAHAEAAPTESGRTAALWATAAYLSGIQVTLATDHRADDRVIRTCLALARASGAGSPPSETTARQMTWKLLKSNAWTHTIPLLPQLAPEALERLGVIAMKTCRRTQHETETG
ncbi:hypothetical protein ACFXBB_06075 [Streptomyces scopuliridis]|uniref:hypothetical protein n=1 Tax=Streptomyces scopuliridis TaxID=452529 RepID=UPI00367F699D